MGLKFQLSVQSEQGPTGSSLKVREFHSVKANQRQALSFSLPTLPLTPRGPLIGRALPQRRGPHHH